MTELEAQSGLRSSIVSYDCPIHGPQDVYLHGARVNGCGECVAGQISPPQGHADVTGRIDWLRKEYLSGYLEPHELAMEMEAFAAGLRAAFLAGSDG